MSRKIALAVFLVMCLLCIGQAVYYYPMLPESVASHFGISGKPDGWSSKSSFIMVPFIITGVITVVFLAVAFGLSKIPVSLINLPNKNYWLSPERKQASLDFFTGYFLWFGSATLVLLIDIFRQTFLVNTGSADALGHSVPALVVYFVFTALWIAGLYMKFGGKTGGPGGQVQAKQG